MDAIVFGLFGLIVGSFLNVLILRNGVRASSGRSACMSCGRAIFWFDLIPVLSWVWLKGRCRFCACKISAQYPLVELATAILFAVVGASPLSVFLRVVGLAIVSILIVISVYDLRHTIIPDSWVWSFNALAFASVFLSTPYAIHDTLYSLLFLLLAGPLSALPLFALWFFSRGRWMGLGDAKLALGIGWLLGPVYGIVAVLFSFIIGAVVSVPLLFFSTDLWRRILNRFTHTLVSRNATARITMHSEVPFGPYLVASCLLVWFSLMYGVPLPLLWQ